LVDRIVGHFVELPAFRLCFFSQLTGICGSGRPQKGIA
jgi:hypothetical protein